MRPRWISWAEPVGRITSRATTFTFIEESSSGTSPKFEVEDEHGITWKVKLGEEAKSETAATRLLWAAGYLVDEVYYRSQHPGVRIPRLDRGREFVSDGDIVSGARLERERERGKSTTWSWYDNPFVGTREFNGLKVMMALINNWDLKDVNNRRVSTHQRRRSALRDHRPGRHIRAHGQRHHPQQERVEGLRGDEVHRGGRRRTHVDFVMQSRPFFPFVVHLPNYRSRTRMESIVKGIPIADARWIGDRLGQLSVEQINDCFRASGFSPSDVEAYTRVVMQRIALLKKLE